MLTKYHSLDGKVTKEAAKGKWSLVGAILFTFLGVCAVSQLMHTPASEASVGVVVETAVGPGNIFHQQEGKINFRFFYNGYGLIGFLDRDLASAFFGFFAEENFSGFILMSELSLRLYFPQTIRMHFA